MNQSVQANQQLIHWSGLVKLGCKPWFPSASLLDCELVCRIDLWKPSETCSLDNGLISRSVHKREKTMGSISDVNLPTFPKTKKRGEEKWFQCFKILFNVTHNKDSVGAFWSWFLSGLLQRANSPQVLAWTVPYQHLGQENLRSRFSWLYHMSNKIQKNCKTLVLNQFQEATKDNYAEYSVKRI